MKTLLLLKYSVFLLIFPSFLFSSEKKLEPEEKDIKTLNPVIIEKLDKEVKDERDIKKSLKKGVGEKGGAKLADPHNFKDVKDNKITVQQISDDEIDPSKFMKGLGDVPDKSESKEKEDKKKVIITPNSKQNPFEDKKVVQDINIVKKYFNGNHVDIGGDISVRLNFGNYEEEDNSFGLQNKFNIYFGKSFSCSEFKISFGSLNGKNSWINISMSESSETKVALKEAYYIKKDKNNLINTQMGRFLSPFYDDDYFFSNYLSFDGVNIYGGKKSFYYKTIVALLKDKNILASDIDVSVLGTLNAGFKNKNIDLSFYYIFLQGNELSNLLGDGNDYNSYNHYLASTVKYIINLKNHNDITFKISGSYNLGAEKNRIGTSIGFKHENESLISKLTLIYKQKNSVISKFALQDDYFISDIVGGNFKFIYKYDEAMKVGIEFSAGKKLSFDESDMNYITRALYSIDF